MAFTVSVRDTRELEKKVREGKEIDLPKECRHNSKVIYEVLQYASRALPQFKLVCDKEIKTIADSVAYLMRTDTIISGIFPIGPNLLNNPLVERIPQIYGGDGILVHLKNDPDQLTPDWEYTRDDLIKAKDFYRAAELARCYVATISWMPKVRHKLDPEYGALNPGFRLADITAFLLTPRDLVDYKYSLKEITRFHNKLLREIEEV